MENIFTLNVSITNAYLVMQQQHGNVLIVNKKNYLGKLFKVQVRLFALMPVLKIQPDVRILFTV